MNNFDIYYKTTLPVHEQWPPENKWDIFISAFTSAQRVQDVFEKAEANLKYWLVLPEYGYELREMPSGAFYLSEIGNEALYISTFWDQHISIPGKTICIDATGFLRPYLVFLVGWLMAREIRRFDVIYSEPAHYVEGEKTKFSGPVVTEVRQIAGFEGVHSTDTTNDLLIINAGYEDNLVTQVAEYKNNSKKVLLLGFPSLRADMYQENIHNTKLAEEAVGRKAIEGGSILAPANDPFVTASVLRRFVDEYNSRKPITNLYLCPLATKPQLIGCTIYYLTELRNRPASIIFPFASSYSKATGIGISRIWKFTVELPSASQTY
jgi:hypothetical protein